jgi:deoxycytidylate deaminase
MNKQEILKNNYFNIARLESLKTDFRSRIGAVIVRKKRIIAIGRNKPTKTHPITKKWDIYKTIHAEIDCIIGTDRTLLIGSDIYVYRELKDGSIAMAKPCDMCIGELKENGIKKAYYTTINGIECLKIN